MHKIQWGMHLLMTKSDALPQLGDVDLNFDQWNRVDCLVPVQLP